MHTYSESSPSSSARRFLDTHDEVTGLLNRVGLHDEADRLATSCEWMSVVFIDVAGLDRIDDVHGHAPFERAVALLAERISAIVPDQIVGRLATGQFVVIAPWTDRTMWPVAQQIERAVTDSVTLEGQRYKLTVDIGLTAARCGYGSVDDAIRDAATAAHFVGKAPVGHSNIRAFNAEMRRAMQAQMHLEVDLDDAVLGDSLDIAFQPIVSLTSGAMTGAEVLMRWARPSHFGVLISQVVEVAEEMGLIVPIGARTIDRVLAIAGNPVVKRRGYTLSVNLSARELIEPELVASIEAGLARSGATPSSIAFELTETAFMADVESGTRTLADLRSLGCSVGLDDFGTGWSSLSRVRDMPIDFVKIDQAFISELDGTGRNEPIVAAIVSLAKAFGIGTIAEGIETIVQRDIAADLGCDRGQGYLFGQAELSPAWLAETDPAG